MDAGKLLIVGAGGQGKVVIDALCIAGDLQQVLLADDDERKRGKLVLGHKVSLIHDVLTEVTSLHVAIGHNGSRERLIERLAGCGLVNRYIAHPRTSVANSARISEGVFIAAHAVVGPDAGLHLGCIVNHGAVVDHDCTVGAYSHIAPNATLGGGVHVGRRVLIGAGANILPGVCIGDDCVVGAGAVVLDDMKPLSVYVGVPARSNK